jgi:hypothetical protein
MRARWEVELEWDPRCPPIGDYTTCQCTCMQGFHVTRGELQKTTSQLCRHFAFQDLQLPNCLLSPFLFVLSLRRIQYWGFKGW